MTTERTAPEIHRSIALPKYQHSFGIILLITLYSRSKSLVSSRVLKILYNSLRMKTLRLAKPSVQFSCLEISSTGSSLNFHWISRWGLKIRGEPETHWAVCLYTRTNKISVLQVLGLFVRGLQPADCMPASIFTDVKNNFEWVKTSRFRVRFFVIGSLCYKVCLHLRLRSARELSVTLYILVNKVGEAIRRRNCYQVGVTVDKTDYLWLVNRQHLHLFIGWKTGAWRSLDSLTFRSYISVKVD